MFMRDMEMIGRKIHLVIEKMEFVEITLHRANFSQCKLSLSPFSSCGTSALLRLLVN